MTSSPLIINLNNGPLLGNINTDEYSFNSLRARSSAPFPLQKGNEIEEDYFLAVYNFENELIDYAIGAEKKANNAFNRGFLRELISRVVRATLSDAENPDILDGLSPEEYISSLSIHYDIGTMPVFSTALHPQSPS